MDIKRQAYAQWLEERVKEIAELGDRVEAMILLVENDKSTVASFWRMSEEKAISMLGSALMYYKSAPETEEETDMEEETDG